MQAACVVGRASMSLKTVHGDMVRPGLSDHHLHVIAQASTTFGPQRGRCQGALRGSSLLYCRKGLSNGSVLNTKRGFTRVKASSSANQNQSSSNYRIAPLELESPTGQFLSQILKSHPHLLLAAIEEQLERLAADRQAAAEQQEPSTSGTELVLYRRIAQLKAKERTKALEEIIYSFIIQKFMDAGISMITTIPSEEADESSNVNAWIDQDALLEAVHSSEAVEMIREHLSLVLGNRNTLSDKDVAAQISKLRVGQVYAASVMYGYFLRRVDRHFQLEKSMKLLPFGLNKKEDINSQMLNGIHPELEEDEDWPEIAGAQGSAAAAAAVAAMAGAAGAPGVRDFNSIALGRIGSKPCKLKAYVMSFDPETLQRYASMRSKESVNIIEKHAEALFGRPEVDITHDGLMTVSKDEVISVSFTGLTSLILEAVTFGTFLWDVETHVESRYPFVIRQ